MMKNKKHPTTNRISHCAADISRKKW